ncbi:MAG: ribosome biogenesis GTPase Der, partial [Ignavibacteria bacterium]|nr:ribosome biogenesis GTPase Der [Ignavibacteria bacterium]
NDEGVEPDFFRLGLGEPLEVSALVGRRSGDLLDMITDNIPDNEPAGTDENGIKFAIIGRPNAGKSSLANALTQSNRNIVTDIPGTTRDPIDSLVTYYGQEITLIDTAGLRKKSRIKRAESLEYFSALRTHKSIERCDVAIIVIDATSFVSKLSKFTNAEEAVFKLGKEDVEIIIKAAELKKGILLVINKWDLVEKETNTAKIFENKVKEHLKTYDYLPFLFTSAITKQRVSKIIERALDVYNERAKEIKTSELNDKLLPYIKEFPPRSKSHKELKINYITQLQKSPPVIGFFCNLPSEIEVNYKRYLENKVRVEFGFIGVPITLAFKKKN